MKSQQVHPVVAVFIILVVLASIGLVFWMKTADRSATGGRLESHLDFSRMETDPIKLRMSIEESLRKNGQAVHSPAGNLPSVPKSR